MKPIETPTCQCGTAVTLGANMYECTAHCPDCYDGTEDAGELAHIMGRGKDHESALWDWQDKHDEAYGVVWVPPLLEELELMICHEAKQQLEQGTQWIVVQGPKLVTNLAMVAKSYAGWPEEEWKKPEAA